MKEERNKLQLHKIIFFKKKVILIILKTDKPLEKKYITVTKLV